VAVLKWTFPGGKLKQEVTSVVLVNNTAKTIDTVVPTGKRWLLLGVKLTNIDDVTRDVSVTLYKEAGKTNVLATLMFVSALAANGAAILMWPNNYVSTTSKIEKSSDPILLVAGNTINVYWATGGASTGATDADGLVIEYLEVDAP